MAKPEKSYKCKPVDLAVWRNERGLSISLTRNYWDQKEQKYKTAKCFYPKDLPALKAVIEAAMEELGTEEQQQQRQPAPPPPDDDLIPF